MEGLVELHGNWSQPRDFHGNVVGRFRKSTSDDARNGGCRQGYSAAMETWIQSRLEGYAQCDELPADEKISPALVPRTNLLQAHGVKQEPNGLKDRAGFPLHTEFVPVLLLEN